MSQTKRHRETAGMSQSELARRAGVSRQLISSLENGRHVPRVDAALAIAGVLGVGVAELFVSRTGPEVVDVVAGTSAGPETIVRLGRIGDRYVSSSVRVGSTGFEAGDAVVSGDTVRHLVQLDPGLVVAGCEPGLVVLEQMLRERGIGAIAVATSSAAALASLDGGRCHAAVVHGEPGSLAQRSIGRDVVRLGLTSWRVGLAGRVTAAGEWWRDALVGDGPVIQRENGAGVQRSFLAARNGRAAPPGPVVGSHLEAARSAVVTGTPAVTIEPAALAVGATFHPIEIHIAELWVDRPWESSTEVNDALAMIDDKRFRNRLTSVGGYDLAALGVRAS